MLKQSGLLIINILFWIFFIASSALLILGSVLIRFTTFWFDPNLKILQKYSCFWASLYLWVNPFWSLKKSGLHHIDPKKTYVIVCNHQSMADILVLFNTFAHFKWVAKKTVFKLPFLGWNMTLNGYIPIDRGNPQSREILFQKCKDWLVKGSSVLFFPEGTRSKDGALLPFKVGAFKLAMETGTDILPLVIGGSLHAIPKHSLLFHRQSKMTLQVLEPIDIKQFQSESIEKSSDALMNFVRQQMSEKTSNLS